MKNKRLCKLIFIIASISGCGASSTDHRSSYHNTDSTICVDTSSYVRYDSYGRESTFACHPGAIASVIETEKPGASRSAGYIVLCNCRDASIEKNIQESEIK